MNGFTNVRPDRLATGAEEFERIALDVSGAYPESDLGNNYILVVMDGRWKQEAYAISNHEAITVERRSEEGDYAEEDLVWLCKPHKKR